eukprot:scaffold2549_cov343-Prasinococcus_capsulatus_cf.AAC.6
MPEQNMWRLSTSAYSGPRSTLSSAKYNRNARMPAQPRHGLRSADCLCQLMDTGVLQVLPVWETSCSIWTLNN